MELDSYIEFIVRGKIGGIQISPKAIDLALFKAFAEDIVAIIKSMPDAKDQSPVVTIEDGSFKAKVAVPLLIANFILADSKTLVETNDLSSINTARSKVLSKWHKKTQTNNSIEFEIRPKGEDGIKINFEKHFKNSGEDIWLESEIYLYGQIVDWGGATKSNIHFVTEDEKTIKIDCKKDVIANKENNLVYKPGAVRVFAKQHLFTGEIKDAKFIDFVDYSPVYSEDQLSATVQKGRVAWQDVEDHVEWVRNLRADE